MKTINASSILQIEPNFLQQLTKEVKETVASDIQMPGAMHSTSFKAIDFWNIRRNGRLVNSGAGRRKSASLSITHVSF